MSLSGRVVVPIMCSFPFPDAAGPAPDVRGGPGFGVSVHRAGSRSEALSCAHAALPGAGAVGAELFGEIRHRPGLAARDPDLLREHRMRERARGLRRRVGAPDRDDAHALRPLLVTGRADLVHAIPPVGGWGYRSLGWMRQCSSTIARSGSLTRTRSKIGRASCRERGESTVVEGAWVRE